MATVWVVPQSFILYCVLPRSPLSCPPSASHLLSRAAVGRSRWQAVQPLPFALLALTRSRARLAIRWAAAGPQCYCPYGAGCHWRSHSAAERGQRRRGTGVGYQGGSVFGRHAGKQQTKAERYLLTICAVLHALWQVALLGSFS